MSYNIGDKVKVVPAHRFVLLGPFRRFGIPRTRTPYGSAKGVGTVEEVISPSTVRGITNTGGYRVRLENGTVHYYSEAELRPASTETR